MADPVLENHHELIAQGIAGNRQALHKLYMLYARAMYNVAMRILNCREDAEEALQDGFTEAFLKLGTFRHESTFGAWLKTIVVHKSINIIRKRKIEWVSEEYIPQVMDDTETEDAKMEKMLDVQRIIHAMEELPHGFRVVFSLYMLEGYDHEEIAGILNISESTSKSQLHRAKIKIRELLQNGSNTYQNERIHR